MPDSKVLKLLLVEDDLEDEQLLREALAEIEEGRHWYNLRTSSVVHVEELADALSCLRQERFDVILLNLSLPDSPALLDTFHEVTSCAGGAPIVVLADTDDRGLAKRLLREGAQDVLLKTELEAAPLARCLQFAMERQRRTQALLASPLADELTGTLTRHGFLTVAEHYRSFSQISGNSLVLAMLDLAEVPQNTVEDRERLDLLLIRAGEVLRQTFPSPTLIGRINPRRFGLVIAGLAETTAENMLNRAAFAIESPIRFDNRTAGTIRLMLTDLDAETGVDEQIDSARVAAISRRRVKTVMLAD